ncbi:MAG: hypothetical protein JXR83_01640 [Deltaproteobacteria bacterium]|nr:hypothetical protein [Deltaproteobacteria bacterium]
MRYAILLLTALALALAGCEPIVHAGCSSDSDCAKRCVTGDRELPGGLCTQTCSHNEDCPGGTFCIDKLGGICALACSSMQECRDFHSGYLCKDKKDIEGSPQLVCLGD